MSIRRSGATVILTYYAKQVGPTPSDPRTRSFKFPFANLRYTGETMNEVYRVGEMWGDFPDVRIFGSGWGFTVKHPLKMGFS